MSAPGISTSLVLCHDAEHTSKLARSLQLNRKHYTNCIYCYLLELEQLQGITACMKYHVDALGDK